MRALAHSPSYAETVDCEGSVDLGSHYGRVGFGTDDNVEYRRLPGVA